MSTEEQFNISRLTLVGGAVGAMREVIIIIIVTLCNEITYLPHLLQRVCMMGIQVPFDSQLKHSTDKFHTA